METTSGTPCVRGPYRGKKRRRKNEVGQDGGSLAEHLRVIAACLRLRCFRDSTRERVREIDFEAGGHPGRIAIIR